MVEIPIERFFEEEGIPTETMTPDEWEQKERELYPNYDPKAKVEGVKKKHNYNPNSGKKALDLDVGEIARLYTEEGLSCSKIARQFNVAPDTILKKLKKVGIERRALGRKKN